MVLTVHWHLNYVHLLLITMTLEFKLNKLKEEFHSIGSNNTILYLSHTLLYALK